MRFRGGGVLFRVVRSMDALFIFGVGIFPTKSDFCFELRLFGLSAVEEKSHRNTTATIENEKNGEPTENPHCWGLAFSETARRSFL